jgi:hypothetical protein
MLISTLLDMSKCEDLPFEITLEVRDTCLCLHLQRAARAWRGAETAGTDQRPVLAADIAQPPGASEHRHVFALLAMDRTTLIANLKPLERRPGDGYGRRGRQTHAPPDLDAGRALPCSAVPAWRRTHADIEHLSAGQGPDRLRADLSALS